MNPSDANHADSIDGHPALALVSQIYDAATGPGACQSLLELLVKAFCAKAAYVRSHHQGGQPVTWIASIGHDDKFRAAYNDLFFAEDPLRERLEAAPVGTVLDSHPAGTPYDRLYLAPQGVRAELRCSLYRDPARTVVLGLLRSRGQGPFGADEVAALRSLAPHMVHAYRIHSTLTATACRSTGMETLLDNLRYGVALTDMSLRPTYVNPEAARLLMEIAAAQGDGGIEEGLDVLREALRKVDAAFFKTDAGSSPRERERTLVLPGARNGDWIHAHIAPLRPPDSPDGRGTACLAVFLCRRGCRTLVLSAALSALYRLTTAEARLVEALASGRTLAQIADECAVSINTVRCQLKSAFFKTGARNQAELVCLVRDSVPAHLTPDPGGASS